MHEILCEKAKLDGQLFVLGARDPVFRQPESWLQLLIVRARDDNFAPALSYYPPLVLLSFARAITLFTPTLLFSLHRKKGRMGPYVTAVTSLLGAVVEVSTREWAHVTSFIPQFILRARSLGVDNFFHRRQMAMTQTWKFLIFSRHHPNLFGDDPNLFCVLDLSGLLKPFSPSSDLQIWRATRQSIFLGHG